MQATREEGLRRLAAFMENGAERYAKTRNFDLGPADRSNVSVLSPYIRHRLVLEQEVLHATLQQHGRRAGSKFIEEVFWRTYFKGWLQQHPSVWQVYRDDLAGFLSDMEGNVSLREGFNTAVDGNTGIDCFDAWARELVATGYLHNHARMWFASIWVFTLGLPWQLGADFFLRHLIDGDPASNTLSWRWVSGLHTRGKTYLARVSNITNYTDGRFNPQGQLATQATPLVESAEHNTQPLRLPNDAIPAERFGLLLTEDDLSAHSLLGDAKPQAIVGLTSARGRSTLPVGTAAYDFATGAAKSATTAVAKAYGVEGTVQETHDWAETLLEWTARQRINTVVVSHPTVGPVNDAFERARPILKREHVRVVEISRDYDRQCWPHAKRGYFRLKKQIDSILQRLELGETDPASSEQLPRQIDFLGSLR